MSKNDYPDFRYAYDLVNNLFHMINYYGDETFDILHNNGGAEMILRECKRFDPICNLSDLMENVLSGCWSALEVDTFLVLLMDELLELCDYNYDEDDEDDQE